MVRTRADGYMRVASGLSSGAKSLKKVASTSSNSSSPSEKLGKDNLPVNRYCPRETPKWQKQITHFYVRHKVGECSSSLHNDGVLSNSTDIENVLKQNIEDTDNIITPEGDKLTSENIQEETSNKENIEVPNDKDETNTDRIDKESLFNKEIKEGSSSSTGTKRKVSDLEYSLESETNAENTTGLTKKSKIDVFL